MLPNAYISGRKAKEVYESIRRRGVISKMDLKETSGLTVSTLTRLLDELAERQLIVEVGLGESTGGRRPILYRTNAHFAYVFGLDISRTRTTLVLCDLHLNKLSGRAWPMDDAMTPERLVRELALAVPLMLGECGVQSDRVLGVGIGAVGPLDRFSGQILNPQNFASPGWSNVDLCAMITRETGLYASLDNGANAALVGEYWSDPERQAEHLLYVHAGVGIRSAMIVGGQLVYGAVDMEGSAGQMIIQCDGPAPHDGSGNYGSWESYASTYAVERMMRAAAKIGRTTVASAYAGGAERIKYPHIEQALKDGDRLAEDVMEQSACYFGIGLANLLNILHPQKVILGGPLVSGNDLFYRQAIRIALQKTYYASTYQVSFERSRLGDEAVAIGAAANVIKQLTE